MINNMNNLKNYENNKTMKFLIFALSLITLFYYFGYPLKIIILNYRRIVPVFYNNTFLTILFTYCFFSFI